MPPIKVELMLGDAVDKNDQYLKNLENSDLVLSAVKDTCRSEIEYFIELKQTEISDNKKTIINNNGFDFNILWEFSKI